MRLDKFLSNMGKGTRSEIKKDIQKGLVIVDDQVIKKVNYAIDPENNRIIHKGQYIDYEPYVYLMMNKPQGVISATEDKMHKTVIDLVKETYGNRKLFPVGRLDIDTEGLLLITDDGQWSHDLMSPKKHVKKIYYAHIQGRVTADDITAFASGIKLGDGTCCQPGILKILESDEQSIIELSITEGKYHQVKRMFEARQKKVVFLKRIQIGNLQLDSNLKLGDYRKMTKDEIKKVGVR